MGLFFKIARLHVSDSIDMLQKPQLMISLYYFINVKTKEELCQIKTPTKSIR